MTSQGIQALKNWSEQLDIQGRLGVFVSGQSLYAEPASRVEGAAADWELPNYDDFTNVVQALILGERPLICVTGDVHWGRILQSFPVGPPGVRRVWEFIVSPSSLVTSVGVDQGKTMTNWLRGLFGREKSWPRHSEPGTSTGPFGNDAGGRRRFRHEIRNKLKGDQLGLLSLVWGLNTRLAARARLWNVGSGLEPIVDHWLF